MGPATQIPFPDEAIVTLVEAPAGFGKTMLIQSWIAALEAADISCLNSNIPAADASQLEARTGLVTAIETFIAAQRAELDLDRSASASNRSNQRGIIFLDACESMSPELASDIQRLMAHSSGRVRWVFSSRRRVDLDLAAFRTAGSVTTLRAEDIASHKVSNGQRLPECWPAIESLQADATAGDSTPSIEVRAYITQHVLSLLPADDRALLVALSPLPLINPSLLRRLPDHAGAGSRVRDIAERDFLLTPEPHATGLSFRMRDIIRRCLLLELDSLGPDARAQRIRFAELMADDGNLKDACAVMIDLGEIDAAALLLERMGTSATLEYGVEPHRALLEAIPLALRETFPRLRLAWAYIAIRSGRVEEARRLYLDTARLTHNFWVDWKGGDVARLQIEARHVEFSLAFWSGETMPIRSIHAYELFTSTAPMTASDLTYSYMLITYGNLLHGNLRAAEEAIRASAQIAGVNAPAVSSFWHHFYSAIIAIERCKRTTAERFLLHASTEMMEHQSVQERNHGLWYDAAEAQLRYELNMLDGLAARLEVVLERASVDEMLFELVARVHLILASTTLAEQGLHQALDVLHDADDLGARLHQPAFARLAAAHRVRLLARSGHHKTAIEYADAAGLLKQLGDFALSVDCSMREFLEIALAASTGEILRGNAGRVLSLLEPCLRRAEEAGCALSHAKLSLIASAAAERSQNLPEAGRHLTAALNTLVSQGMYRPFIDESALVEPILVAAIRSPAQFGFDSATAQEAGLALSVLKKTGQRSWFSEREIAILQRLAAGEPNKIIARILNMSENTVKYHLKAIYIKLGANDRKDAVIAAMSCRIL